MCKQALRVSSRQITSYRWVPPALSWNVVSLMQVGLIFFEFRRTLKKQNQFTLAQKLFSTQNVERGSKSGLCPRTNPLNEMRTMALP